MKGDFIPFSSDLCSFVSVCKITGGFSIWREREFHLEKVTEECVQGNVREKGL